MTAESYRSISRNSETSRASSTESTVVRDPCVTACHIHLSAGSRWHMLPDALSVQHQGSICCLSASIASTATHPSPANSGRGGRSWGGPNFQHQGGYAGHANLALLANHDRGWSTSAHAPLILFQNKGVTLEKTCYRA